MLVRRDRSAPVVAIVTHVKAGYFDETDDVAGVSHVLEHMYFKGTPTRGVGEIARETKRAGGYLNAGTIYDRTTYYTVLPSSGLEAGLAVQSDAYGNSLIDAGELARELEVIIEEERRKRDTPSAVAIEECFALLHDVHRIRRWRIGHPEGLRRLTRDDVLRFYRAHYTPPNTVLSIVGDVDPARVLQLVEQHHGSLPGAEVQRDRGPSEPPRTGFRWREFARDVEHSQVVLGWRTVDSFHEDTAPLDVAAGILGAGRASRLFREVRERSLASSVAVYHYTPTELGVFVVAAESPPARAAEAARAVWAQVREFAKAGPDATELERVRRGIEARWARALESMEGQATYLAAWEAHGGWEQGAAYREALLTTSREAIASAAARYLTLDRAALVTLRPHTAEPFAADLPAARACLEDAVATRGHRAEPATIDAPALVGFGDSPELEMAGVAVFRTDAGMPVLVRRKPGAPVTHVQALFLGGVCDESEARAGWTTLLARAALQGTAHRDGPQFAEELESLGGRVHVVVGTEAFGWAMSVPPAQLGQALTLLADVVEQPALPSDALETERTIALAGLAQLRDDMSTRPLHLARALAFPGHSYGRPMLGTEAGVRGATVSRLRAWHERRVRTGVGAVVVVGDVDPGEVAALVRGAFRGLAPGERRRRRATVWPTHSDEAVEVRDKAQTAIALLLPGPVRSDPGRYALGLLGSVATGLGGRIFEALRERESLAYSVSVSSRSLQEGGWLSGYLACAPSKEDAARSGLLRELTKFVEEPVSSDELERARAYALGSFAIRQQSAAAVLGDVANAWLFGSLQELDDGPRIIEALTADDLQAAARASVDPARAIWGIVRGAG